MQSLPPTQRLPVILFKACSTVKKLVDSVVSYQERSIGIIAEMRKLSTQNSAEIRDAVEDGKRRLALLVEQGAAAALTVRTSGSTRDERYFRSGADGADCACRAANRRQARLHGRRAPQA